MKKLLSIVVICFLPFCSFANKDCTTELSSNLLEAQQTSNWEYLGKVSAYYFLLDWSDSEFDLYVKVISGKTFYQVRSDGKSYFVSTGSFNCHGKTFNASFKKGSFTYYLNI